MVANAATKKYASVTTATIPIADIEPASYNARLITQEALSGLARSMEEFGLLALPIVNKRPEGYRLVGGHQRVRVLKEEGKETVECVVVEFDDTTEKRANFTLNNRAIQGEFVPELTKALLDEIRRKTEGYRPEVFDDLRFDNLMRQIVKTTTPTKGVDDVESKGKTDDDAEPGISKSGADSKPGLFYKLGEHVLLCHRVTGGLSLKGFPVANPVMGFMRIAAKSAPSQEYVDAYLNNMLTLVHGPLYLATNFATLPMLHRRFKDLGGHWSNTLMWTHPSPVGSDSERYKNAAIPVLYGWMAGSSHYFCGARDQGNVFKLRRNPKAELPVEIAVRCLLNSTKAKDYVLDLDVGKGVTLIAAEKTNRRLIGYVATPRDMDAVRQRWAEFVHEPGVNWKAATPAL